MEAIMHKFYGIGVGPGDPELLTVKAAKKLSELDVLVVPQGKSGGASEAHQIASPYLTPKTTILYRHFPMTSDTEAMMAAIEPIALEIEALVNEGKDVGFVTLGDPMLYSTYIYLLKFIKDAVPIETLTGISSYSAIASGTNQPLVEGDMPLLIYPCIEDLSDLDQKLQDYEALVLMKVYRSFDAIKALILKHGLENYCVIVSDFGKPGEKRFNSIQSVSFEDIRYFTTIIINKRWSK
jgi:precorrin-2 C(20)-methyltransferase